MLDKTTTARDPCCLLPLQSCNHVSEIDRRYAMLIGGSFHNNSPSTPPNQISAARNTQLALIDLVDEDLCYQLGILINFLNRIRL